mmetsp:Transcript_20386/g.19701  ORF Transcript_20386/g.19701 Transcript_20386/m.19701 type:complete len:161 (+) Transcript_20386:107-589(+)|eukprot:CAMPEP_0119037816 /NCGR_PEP_ID=MMETSP1177-20130426/6332_1 /TAXON_ID=2985 /ORGANISM="Ochromonas sp, Strain CCMP1899" /LENGTH=160 /DNA_ID=CAMNT_0006999529 /DNA_START=96 /DNA_END=578 /DNA_ORIENTATION=-
MADEKAVISNTKTPEFEPPQACVSRIIKNVLPENVQITKDARAAFTRAAGIFIFYLTHCANDFSKESKRQTIYTQDVISALKELSFGDLEKPLEEFLEIYRKEAEVKKPKDKKQSGSGEGGEATGATEEGEGEEDQDASAMKDEDDDEEGGKDEDIEEES